MCYCEFFSYNLDINWWQNDFYYRYFAWIDLEIRGRAKVALLEKRDEAGDLKADMKRWFDIVRRYNRENFCLKEHVAELKRENRFIKRNKGFKERGF